MKDIQYLFKGGPVDGKHLPVPCNDDGIPISPYYEVLFNLENEYDAIFTNSFKVDLYKEKLFVENATRWYEFEFEQ